MTVHRITDMTRPAASTRNESVVLVHGMLSGRRSMQPLADALMRDGFQVTNWTYRTMRHSIGDHAVRLAEELNDRRRGRDPHRMHFVGHSMGCIVLRQAIDLIDVPRGSRLVMMAPPNSGSRLTRLPLGPFAAWFPHLLELSEASDSFVNRLPEPTSTEVGVIAAKRDLIVDLESTRLKSMRDHLVIDSTHQKLTTNSEAIRQTRHFLANGRFDQEIELMPPTIRLDQTGSTVWKPQTDTKASEDAARKAA